MLNVTALGAHPDDIEIFMYGALAACRERGDKISLIVATDGAAGAVGDDKPGANLAKKRSEETKQGLAQLGTPILLGMPDGLLSGASNATETIQKAISKTNPDLILTHAPEDYHPDHRALSGLVTEVASFRCPIVFADTLMGVGFMPEFYVDITPYAEEKTQAILAHQSQQPERFVKAATIMNRYRAAQCNAPEGRYAEAYRSPKRFPFTDLRDLLPPPPPLRPFYVADSDALI